MKKIFLFLFLVFTTNSFSALLFDVDNYSAFRTTQMNPAYVGTCQDWSMYDPSLPVGSYYGGYYKICTFSQKYYSYADSKWGKAGYYVVEYRFKKKDIPELQNNQCTQSTISNEGSFLSCSPSSDNGFENKPNPDPEGGSNCRDLFLGTDGVAYTCNPNTNEATPIPNSDGLTTDPETGDNIPNCNEGYEYTVLPSGMNPSGDGTSSMYNQYGCASSSGTGNTGGDTGTGGDVTTTTNPDGSTTMTLPDGTTHTTYGDGTVITTYPDGTQTTSNTGGVGGSTGGGPGGTGSDYGQGSLPSGGMTTPETGTTGDNNDMTPTDPATACNDSNLTLQEKMMCQINQGIKNLNGDSTNSNSLNNLMKDINADNNKNFEAINKSIKDSGTYVSAKIDTTNQLLTTQNKTLDSLATKQNTTNTLLGATNNGLTDINNNLEDTEGKSYLQTLTEKFTDLTSPITDDEKSTYSSQVNSKISNTLNDTFSTYSNILGLGSNYAPAPANITVTLFGIEFVLINFSLLDSYVSVIRSLFLTLAYIYGLLFFLRGAK